jgi:hypothetical protein
MPQSSETHPPVNQSKCASCIGRNVAYSAALPRNQSQMRPGAPSAFYRTKRTECSAMDVKFNRVCACYGGIRGLRIVARKSYGRIAMDSCLVAQCSNGLCLAALKTTAYTCPVGVLASCVESPIRTAPFRNFETAALCCHGASGTKLPGALPICACGKPASDSKSCS